MSAWTFKTIAKRATGRAILLSKMFLDRRRFRGLDEFVFRWRSAPAAWHAISVQARSNAFARTIFLRKGTSDLWTFEQIFCNNDYNLRKLARWEDVTRWYSALQQRGTPLILDLGANVGLASIYFACNWPNARIVPVEPDAGNFMALTKNTEGMPNIKPIRAAIANSDGAVKIANPGADAWAIRTEVATAGDGNNIRAVSVPTLLEEGRRDGAVCLPFICKIDIEGFEKNLFEKNIDWIALFPIIIIELHDWMLPGEATSNAFLRAVAGHDRDFVYVGENVFSIRNDGGRTARDLAAA